MPFPTYIQFLRWAETRLEPFTYLDVEFAFHVPRELVVQLVSLAVEKGRVENVNQTHWRFRTRGFPGSQTVRNSKS